MIDVVIPTYRRTALLKRVLPYYSAQRDVSSILIVEDGPLSPEVAALAQENAAPVIVTIATGCQAGAPGAKRLGLEYATSEFVAFGEDDAFPIPNYYSRLLSHVQNGLADVASGAVHYLCTINERWTEGAIAKVEDRPSFGIIHEDNGLFYGAATQALYLGPRELLLRYPPDFGYKGNGWREETDPLIALWGEGGKVALDPKAVFYHLPRNYQQGGGQHARSRITYEYWCMRNDIRFFMKHHISLQKLGFHGPAFLFALMQSTARWKGKLAARFTAGEPAKPIPLPILDSPQ